MGLTFPFVTALSLDQTRPSTLSAATSGGGVFKTTNGGATWGALNDGLSDRSVLSLAIDPRATSTLYAGTSGGGIFKSSDAGATWSASSAGLPGGSPYVVTALAVSSSGRGTVFAGTIGGLFISNDGGKNWSGPERCELCGNLGNLPGVRALAFDPADPSVLYAATDLGVYKSTDDGNTWPRPRVFDNGGGVRPGIGSADDRSGLTDEVVRHRLTLGIDIKTKEYNSHNVIEPDRQIVE